MASRCVGCQNRDAAIADLTKEVERLSSPVLKSEWQELECKLARLVDGLEKCPRYCEAWPEKAPFISAADVRELIAQATGEKE